MLYNNRFTDRASSALQLAQEAAGRMGHNYVGSEHRGRCDRGKN